MKTSTILTINAFMMIGLGIWLTLYGPNFLAFFQFNDLLARLEGEAGVLQLIYWMVVSFARLFGAGLLGTGIILWSLRTVIGDPGLDIAKKRAIVFALLLANLIATFTAITQQFSVWGTISGWFMVGVFALFSIAYTYALARTEKG